MDLRKKILNLSEGLDIYSQLLKDEETILIPFAISQYGTVCLINELLPEYLADMENNECKESLCLDFDQMTSVDYWMGKLVKLRSDMEMLGTVPMKEHGFVVTILGFSPETTMDLYRAIEQKIMKMVEMLKRVEAMLKAPSPELYQNFYRNLRAQYCEDQAVTDFKTWLRSSGMPSLDKFKTFRAEKIITFIKGGTLACASEPSEAEWEKVNIERFKKQVPLSCQEEEWFKKCFDRQFVVFNRTVSWKGDILMPDYACAGLFIFQHWDQLTENDIQAIFHLDKTLELIHKEMTQLEEFSRIANSAASIIRHCITLLMAERFGDEPLFCQQSHWQAVYRILVDKGCCRDSDFNGFDTFIQKVMPDKVNKPYRKDSVKQISQTDFNKPFDRWKYDSAISCSHRTYERMVVVASRFKAFLEENGL